MRLPSEPTMSEPTESIDPSPAAAQSDRGRPDLSVVIPVWNGEHNLGKLLPRVFRTALALPCRDLASGFRLYARGVIDDRGPVTAQGLDSLQEIVARAFAQGWKIEEVPLYYPQPKRWTSGRAAELGIGYLRTIGRL